MEPIHRWDNCTKQGVRMCLDLCFSGCDLVMGSTEHGNETSGYIKSIEFVD
jgi:hypothetical protein